MISPSYNTAMLVLFIPPRAGFFLPVAYRRIQHDHNRLRLKKTAQWPDGYSDSDSDSDSDSGSREHAEKKYRSD